MVLAPRVRVGHAAGMRRPYGYSNGQIGSLIPIPVIIPVTDTGRDGGSGDTESRKDRLIVDRAAMVAPGVVQMEYRVVLWPVLLLLLFLARRKKKTGAMVHGRA